MSRKFIILLVVFVTLLVILGVSGLIPFGEKYDPDDPAYNKAYWSQSLTSRDASSVYRDFKTKNSNNLSSKQHLSAHVFGESLYDELGTEGLTVCDSDFGFGCFHGFFTRAVSQEGFDIVSELDASCVSAFGPLGTGCQHGIGHGIMEYVGFDDVSTALAACKDTTQLVPLLGCTSGVFMEYRIPIVIDAGSAEFVPRPYDEMNPYLPCASVPQEFQASCYFELPGWWRAAFASDYSRMEDLCDALTIFSDKRSCYLGIGAVIPETEGYDADESIAVCNGADSILAKRLCFAGVSWGFYVNPEKRDLASLFCEQLEGDERTICVTESDLTEGLDEGRSL
jgi:hypothetical protein